MFVPYEPYLAFDVQRSQDRCVCGCSAVTTFHEGIDTGYCTKCSKLRREFTEKIVGSIELPKTLDNSGKILEVVEEIRKSHFAERIYFLIDSFFANRQDKDKSLPYNNDTFLAKVYREKFDMMETFMPNLPKIACNPAFARMRVYSLYYSKLEEMMDIDWDELCKLDAKLGNYPYKKEPRGNNIRY